VEEEGATEGMINCKSKRKEEGDQYNKDGD
jgi:hypothetical protein